jgi:uncharacterized protein (DUF58 family)
MRPAAATGLLGLALVLSAAIFDGEPLYVPGIGLIVLAVTAVAWVVAAARGVRVMRAVGARRVQEDEPVAVAIVVDGGRLPLPAGTIEDDLLAAPAPVASGQRRARVNIRVHFARRGRKVLAPPRVVVRDPFGLASVPVTARDEAEVLVLPRVHRVRLPRGDGRGPGTALRSGSPAVAAEVDLDGLRPHREGAPASRIYWQGLARWGELMERRLRAEGDTRPLVLLDLRAPASRDAADAAVRASASLAVALARDGGCAVLLPGDRRPTVLEPTLAGWPALHARLAVMETEAVPSLSGVAARRGPVL